MDKNKRIGLIVLLVFGIVLCTWSIYNSVVSMSQNDNNTTSEAKNNEPLSQNGTGNPVIIDESNDAKDSDKSEDKNETKTSETLSNNIDKNETESSDSVSDVKYISYTVEEGDTIKSICEKYSESCPTPLLSKAILLSNNLKSAKDIKEGMSIKIPEKYTIGGLKYTVRSGDSISSIVTKYMNEMDYAEAIKILKADNFLTSDNIRVGDVLFVAASDLSLVNAKANDSESDVEKDTTEDEEESGSTIDKEESTATLKTLNNRIGTITTYTVKKGDTLASISKKYNETCPSKSASNIILKINGLSKASDIKEGMELKLPEEYLSSGTIYTVKVGDTLSSIVSENLGDLDWYEAVSILSEDNGIENDNIFAGQELFIASIE